MTTAPHWLAEACTSTAALEKPRPLAKYAVEALGTFGLSQLIAGAFTGIAFLTFGSAAR
jgi:hypothetical protein